MNTGPGRPALAQKEFRAVAWTGFSWLKGNAVFLPFSGETVGKFSSGFSVRAMRLLECSRTSFTSIPPLVGGHFLNFKAALDGILKHAALPDCPGGGGGWLDQEAVRTWEVLPPGRLPRF